MPFIYLQVNFEYPRKIITKLKNNSCSKHPGAPCVWKETLRQV